jgi:hypothetical protein
MKKGQTGKKTAVKKETVPAPEPQKPAPKPQPVVPENNIGTLTLDELLRDISAVQDEVIIPEMEDIPFNIGEIGLVGEAQVYLTDPTRKNISGSTVIFNTTLFSNSISTLIYQNQ